MRFEFDKQVVFCNKVISAQSYRDGGTLKMFKMDFKARDSMPPSENLASLEKLYTDFDQWLEKFRKFILERYQELNENTTGPKLTEANVHLQEMLVQGIFHKKVPFRDFDKLRKDVNSYPFHIVRLL